MWLALTMLGCGGPPDAARLASALAEADAAAALRACAGIQDPQLAGECLATIARRPALSASQAAQACRTIEAERWAGECWFTVAERPEQDRRGALEACGLSGPFYDECLYHRWTRELAAVASAAPSATAAVEPARDIVAFWSSLQTIAGDPADQLWGDLWFFAWNEHRPADLAACAALPEGDAARCREHTQAFVLRAILGDLLAPGAATDVLDRTCRAGAVPERITAGLFVPHPALQAQVAEAARLSCDAARGVPVRRYNPVFTARTGAPR